MELSTDIFNREAQFQHHSDLTKALNRDLSESSTAKIENLLVDPFKVGFIPLSSSETVFQCIIYYSDTNLNIWAVRLTQNNRALPRRLVASLYSYSYIKFQKKGDREHMNQKVYMVQPTLDLTIFEVTKELVISC